MKISIVTICYNNIRGLKKTANSVLSQKGIKNIDYIVVDGGSTDGTSEYLKTLPDSVKWISEKDRGISDAFNKGVKMATGDAILMLNSGDTFVDSSVIERIIVGWEKKNVDILSYKVQVDNNTTIPSTSNSNKIWNLCDEPHQGTLVSKRVYEEIGGYSEEYKIRMDFHFFARCRTKNYKFEFIPETIVNYEPGGVSMKLENRRRFWEEGMAVKMQYNIPTTLKDMVKFFIYRFG